MWRRIDNSLYQYLRKKMYDDYYPNLWAGAFMLALIGMVFIPFLTTLKTHPVLFIIEVSMFVIAGLLFFVGFFFLKKNRDIINKLDHYNNAQTCKAILVKKKSMVGYRPNNEKACFQVIVELGGRKLEVHCCKDVFVGCLLGEEVYLIDFLGEEAANPKTCMAIRSLDALKPRYSPETMGAENYSILYERTNGGIADIIDERLPIPDGDEYARVIKNDQCEAIKRKERKFMILVIMGLLPLIGLDIFSFGPIYKNYPVLWAVFLMASIFYFFFVCAVCITVGNRLLVLKRYQALTLEVVIQDIAFVQYNGNKRNYSTYYYRCRTVDGVDVVVQSKRKSRVPVGQTALAVYYDEVDVKFYPTKVYRAN